MNTAINNYIHNNNLNDLITEYSLFSKDIKIFVNDMISKKIAKPSDKQKKFYDYWKKIEENIESLNPKGKGLKILTTQQMLSLLAILLAKYKQEIILNHLKMN